jgi:hypothetical protein
VFSLPGCRVSAIEADSDGFGLLTPDVAVPTILGSVEPRLWTRPLRELTEETSYGFRVITFADRIGWPLDPWEAWLVIHAGELLPDGRPRFRKVLVLVARQNGKTTLLMVLILFWLFEEKQQTIMSTSTSLEYARVAWQKAVALCVGSEGVDPVPELAERMPRKGGVRLSNGEQTLTTSDGCEYKIAATNRRAGRSLTINRYVGDEIREHDDWDAYNAAIHAMTAVPTAQAFLISNQGDARAVVLRALRRSALTFIRDQTGDPRLGLFEWSSPEGSSPTDPPALAMANPNLGTRVELADLLGEAHIAMEEGGEALAGFMTEAMCMYVPMLNPAIDPAGWLECGDVESTMDALRNRVACCLDVSLDSSHATLMAAAVAPDGRVLIEVVEHWDNTRAMRRALPRVLAKVKPRVFGWIPNGPAAVVAAELKAPRPNKARRSAAWPPPGVQVEEIRAELPAVCMGFADLVEGRQIIHPDDELINAHMADTEKLWKEDVWVFARRGSKTAPAGPIDAAYAAAGAVHLARKLPAPPRRTRLVIAK